MVQAARETARAAAKPSTGVQILLADRDAGACDAAVANAERAGVLGDVIVAQQALSDADLAALGPHGLVLTNPPYGLRVTDGNDLRSLYARLGDVLRDGGTGWRLAMLVPDRQLAAQLRMKMDTKLRTANGGIGVSVEMTRAVGARASSTQAPESTQARK
jgi:23S rRNA G2445 N2-methylase RlmL